jgi:hypothetical protein
MIVSPILRTYHEDILPVISQTLFVTIEEASLTFSREYKDDDNCNLMVIQLKRNMKIDENCNTGEMKKITLTSK